jgi:hypothetical protein
MFTVYVRGFPYTLFHEVDVGEYLRFVRVAQCGHVLLMLYRSNYHLGPREPISMLTRKEIYRIRRILWVLGGMQAVIDNHKEHLASRQPMEPTPPFNPLAG